MGYSRKYDRWAEVEYIMQENVLAGSRTVFRPTLVHRLLHRNPKFMMLQRHASAVLTRQLLYPGVDACRNKSTNVHAKAPT